MSKKNNSLLIGDELYAIDSFYKEGARAMRNRTPWNCNPYRDGSQRAESWGFGHVNESGEEHVRFGIDVIEAEPKGTVFKDDPSIPRNEHGDVADGWYEEALAKTKSDTGLTIRKPLR